MRRPTLPELGLATALSISGGVVASSCNSEPAKDTHTIEATVNDCRDLAKVTDIWWNEDVGGWRNGIRRQCQTILMEENR